MAVSPSNRIVKAGRGEVCRAGNVARIVYPDGFREISPERAQVVHFPSVPYERVMYQVTRQVGLADNVSTIVCALSKTHRPTKVPKIDHVTVVPEKRVLGGDARSVVGREARVGTANNHAGPLIITTRPRGCIRAAESADVLEVASFPEKRPNLYSNAEHGEGIGNAVVRDSNRLPSVVERDPDTVAAARNGAKVDHSEACPENSPVLRKSSERVDNSGLRCTKAPSAVVDGGSHTAVPVCKCAEVAHDAASPAICVSHEAVRIEAEIRRERIGIRSVGVRGDNTCVVQQSATNAIS
jgi:hypothetical protein